MVEPMPSDEACAGSTSKGDLKAMKQRHSLVLIVLMLLQPITAQAETYLGIGPLDSRAMVLGKLPGARLEEVRPVWIAEDEWLYEIKGTGISGTVLFKTSRRSHLEFLRLMLSVAQRQRDSISVFGSDADRGGSYMSFLDRQIQENTEALERDHLIAKDSAQVKWIRWLPVNPIPLRRFVGKYGDGATKGYSDISMEPYYE